MWAMSELNDMSCAKFADMAAELALGVLTGRERAEALAHLDHCEACREHVRQLTVTGERLLGLLPTREPPPGFETRVMERLGMPVPDRRRPGHAGLGGRLRRLARAAVRWPAVRPQRLLAAAAVAVAVAAAGLGGWGLRAVTSPRASSPLSSAALVTASHRPVGEIFYYDGNPRWVYMSVDMYGRSGTVTCLLETTDGKVTTLGSFQLSGGYGSWASPDPVSRGTVASARLVAADGTVLATAALSHAR
jgi:hypothetical protein